MTNSSRKDTLAELKKEYINVQKKYNLPDFNKLNNEFEIERLAERKTGFLLKGIRRSMEKRVEIFLKMLEEFINPSFASLASLTLIKSFTEREKLLIKDSYQNLVDLMLKSAVLETDYDEKKEAEYIKEAIKMWEATKKDLNELLRAAERIWKRKIEEEKIDYKYFG